MFIFGWVDFGVKSFYFWGNFEKVIRALRLLEDVREKKHLQPQTVIKRYRDYCPQVGQTFTLHIK
jgi:hypothetical protein